MSGRSRQLMVVLLLAIVALLVVGCALGGGGGSNTTDTGIKVTTTNAGSGGTQGTGKPITAGEGLPADFTAALGHKAVVVLFYVAGNADDKSVLDTLNQLKSSFGQYSFFIYDYKDSTSYGTLAQSLKVDTLPYMVLIDAAGIPQHIFKGYVDQGTLNQALVNLGRE